MLDDKKDNNRPIDRLTDKLIAALTLLVAIACVVIVWGWFNGPPIN